MPYHSRCHVKYKLLTLCVPSVATSFEAAKTMMDTILDFAQYALFFVTTLPHGIFHFPTLHILIIHGFHSTNLVYVD